MFSVWSGDQLGQFVMNYIIGGEKWSWVRLLRAYLFI